MTHNHSYGSGIEEITKLAFTIFWSPEEAGYRWFGWDNFALSPTHYVNSNFFLSFNKVFKLLVRVLKRIKMKEDIYRNAFYTPGNGKPTKFLRRNQNHMPHLRDELVTLSFGRCCFSVFIVEKLCNLSPLYKREGKPSFLQPHLIFDGLFFRGHPCRLLWN